MLPVTVKFILLFLCFCTLKEVIVTARYTDKEIDALTKKLAKVLVEEIGVDKKATHQKRVIGGEDVDDIWPWLVSMRVKVEKEVEKGAWFIKWTEIETSWHHFCGASLLNKRWLLTAAHCFVPDSNSTSVQSVITHPSIVELYEARLGDKDLSPSLWEKIQNKVGEWWNKLFGQDSELLDNWLDYVVGFEKIIIHPDYIPAAAAFYDNDIALVKLAGEVPAAPEEIERISSVTLPRIDNDLSWPKDGSKCVLKGWGCTKHEGDVSEIAQKGVLPKVNDKECSELFGGAIPITHRVCAGPMPRDVTELEELIPHMSKGDSACPGDSGGPLMCDMGNSGWVQAGVASFVPAYLEGLTNYFPSVFTRVSRYVDWIDEAMNNN